MSDPYPAICDYEGFDYQASFWGRGGRAYEDRAEALALARLLPSDGRRLLEVGAGAGRHTTRYRGFEEITLLDYSRSQLEQARQRLGDSARYPYVVAGAYRTPFGAEKVEFTRLNYDFHPRAVRSWLQQAGFIVERQIPVSFLRVAWLKRTIPLPVLLALESVLQRLGAAGLVSPSVFVRTRATGDQAESQSGLWRCPACDSLDLSEGTDGLACRGCGRHWPKRAGIFEFRQPSPDAS